MTSNWASPSFAGRRLPDVLGDLGFDKELVRAPLVVEPGRGDGFLQRFDCAVIVAELVFNPPERIEVGGVGRVLQHLREIPRFVPTVLISR